jgi:sRNA-binding protein
MPVSAQTLPPRRPYRIERDRGTEDARQQLGVFREKWPLAFPVEHQDVRPLAMGVARQVAAAMGWSLPYTLGVLGRWKMAPVYCQAVLCYDQRIALDGSPAETVDAEAKDLATKQLAQLAARKTAKKAAEASAPAVVKPKPAPAPTETPEQLRDRVRATPQAAGVRPRCRDLARSDMSFVTASSHESEIHLKLGLLPIEWVIFRNLDVMAVFDDDTLADR